MTIVALFAIGWLAGAGLAWAFIHAATRTPTPEPFMPLNQLADLARVA